MNVAEWILVVMLSIALLTFLIVGIILMIKLLELTDEAKKVAIKSQNVVDNANNVVTNVRGMTSIGGVVQTFVDRYIEPKLKTMKPMGEKKEKTDGKEN